MHSEHEHKGRLRRILAAIGLCGSLVGCSADDPAHAPRASAEVGAVGLIDDARIVNHVAEPGSWLAHGRTYGEQRFSPLTQIDRTSVAGLGLAWHKAMGTRRAPLGMREVS